MKANKFILVAALLIGVVLTSAPANAQRAVSGAKVPPSFVKKTSRQFEKEQWPDAKAGMLKIMEDERYRDLPLYNFMMGVCWLDAPQGNTDKAKELLNRVIEVDQTFAEAYFHLARCWIRGPLEQQDIARAKSYLEEAMTNGFDVLGRTSKNSEFPADQFQGAPFVRKLLEAQTRFKFENLDRTDPFIIPRELLNPRESVEGGGVWNFQAQDVFIRRLEELWREAARLIDMADPEQIEIGLEKYQELVDAIEKSGEMITRPEFRKRLAQIQKQMEEKKRIIKIKILERYIKQGKEILARMEVHKNNKEYDTVIDLFNNELYPLTNSMIATDEDFTDVAQEILGKGSTLHEEAQVGKEIQALQLEVVGIVIADGLEEMDEFGKDTGKRKRSTIILNKTEEYKGTEDPVPLSWAPKQRKYYIGSTIIQIAELKIQEIERTKVICLYKDRYEIDLDLKKRGELDEE